MGAEERARAGRGSTGISTGQAAPWLQAPLPKLKGRRVASGAKQLHVVFVERPIRGEQASLSEAAGPRPPNPGSTACPGGVRERAGYLDVYGAVGVGRHTARVRQLAKPGAVRPHRKYLLAERVGADGIATR